MGLLPGLALIRPLGFMQEHRKQIAAEADQLFLAAAEFLAGAEHPTQPLSEMVGKLTQIEEMAARLKAKIQAAQETQAKEQP